MIEMDGECPLKAHADWQNKLTQAEPGARKDDPRQQRVYGKHALDLVSPQC